MQLQNILKANYNGNKVIKVCSIGLLFVVLAASPFCILPSKYTIEEFALKEGQRFTFLQNFICTLLIILFALGISISVDTIADAMTILGATTNTAIGFLIPIIFYLKHEGKKGGKFSNMKVLCYIVFTLACVSSVIELYTFAYKKRHPGEF